MQIINDNLNTSLFAFVKLHMTLVSVFRYFVLNQLGEHVSFVAIPDLWSLISVTDQLVRHWVAQRDTSNISLLTDELLYRHCYST